MQSPKLLLITGLSGAGKTTIARLLQTRLIERGCAVCLLDGDILRSGLCSDLDFTDQGRTENIRRAGEVARLFLQSRISVIVALIAPFRRDRRWMRSLVGQDFVEIYVNLSLEECEKRDPKGLYKKARQGELELFTGISSCYEPPLHPEIVCDTRTYTPEVCADRIMEYLDDVS